MLSRNKHESTRTQGKQQIQVCPGQNRDPGCRRRLRFMAFWLALLTGRLEPIDKRALCWRRTTLHLKKVMRTFRRTTTTVQQSVFSKEMNHQALRELGLTKPSPAHHHAAESFCFIRKRGFVQKDTKTPNIPVSAALAALAPSVEHSESLPQAWTLHTHTHTFHPIDRAEKH